MAADPAPFDLAGPALDVHVTHAGATLPISETPNLSTGDELWIRPDLPPGESVRYLLVAAFLRGATNPPPETWFHKWRTWDRKAADGFKVTVPDGAEQVLLFLAPDTSGGYDTLVKAVRGRPGAFVRASQDLNQAMLDRSRLDAFAGAVRRISQSDPQKLKEASPLLARSLAIKLDTECLQKVAEDQAPCLTRGQDALVLNDGQSASMVQSLTTGDTANLIQSLSSTPQAGFGYYSPYIASVMDIARILDSFHTAQYQYIPALASAGGERLSLQLNTPPSFKNPMSVLVVALPAVGPPQPPPVHPVDPKAAYCLAKADMALAAEGAPLLYSTAYAHDLTLKLKGSGGETLSLPVRADAEKGGLVLDPASRAKADAADAREGALQGAWGFSTFTGPTFALEPAKPAAWRLAGDDQQPLTAGRDTLVTLAAPPAACVESVALEGDDGKPVKLDWKPQAPDKITVSLPLKEQKPGAVTLLVKQYGAAAPDQVSLDAYAQPADLDGFILHAGDSAGVLKGRRLRQVTGLKIGDVAFKPDKPAPGASLSDIDQLSLTATDPAAAAKLTAGQTLAAKVQLKDGRSLKLETTIELPRPSVTLISMTTEQAPKPPAPPAVELEAKDELPRGASLVFSIRAQSPPQFTGDEKVEIAREDGAPLATLTTGDGLTFEDPQVLVAKLDTGKGLGPAAFGALRFRILAAGVPGDWRPLAQLVRAPSLRSLTCPEHAERTCQLSGSDLFLIDSLSADPAFTHPVKVPDGFTGEMLSAPRPEKGKLYVRLRDDPAAVNLISLPHPHPAEPPKAANAPQAPAKGPSGG